MGLFDRNYMRGTPRYFTPSDGMSMIWKLIIANIAVFLLVQLTPGPEVQFLDGTLGRAPSKVFEMLALTPGGIRSFHLYQLVTAGFLHEEFWHIALNMWGLYLFGSLIAPHLSGRRILWLYLVSAVSGNLLFLVFNWGTPTMLCGASGAVYGVMMAAAMLEPNRRFMLILLPMFPLKTSTMVICFTILELLQQIGGVGGNIAHLAHLGGFLGGYIYLKMLPGLFLSWDPLKMLKLQRAPKVNFPRRDNGFRPNEYRSSDWGAPRGDFRSDDAPVSQRELDRLLDKISTGGINSLNEEELVTLRRAREQMKRQGR